jgi:hypothetical protein
VGPGLHAGCVGSRRGAPTWRGCMPPAWLSALSPASLGESGGMLVTAGRLHAPRAAVGFFCPGPACMTRGAQPPRRRGRTLECVGEDSAHDGWGRKWGELPLKGGQPPWRATTSSRSPQASCLSTFRAPGWGTPAVLPSCRRRNATSWKLVPFSHCSASRIFIMQPG